MCPFINIVGEQFCIAELVQIKETTFGHLDDSDSDGYEKFESEKVMYATYSKYYSKPIGPETPLKIIKFKLLNLYN